MSYLLYAQEEADNIGIDKEQELGQDQDIITIHETPEKHSEESSDNLDNSGSPDTPDSSEELLAVKQLEVASDAKWLCELFMLKLVNDGVKQAFSELKPYFPIPGTELSMLEMQTYQQIELVKGRYGKVIGYSFVEEQIVSDTVLRFVYLQKFENHAIRWMFYFYKPEETWIFNEFYFDDKIREFF